MTDELARWAARRADDLIARAEAEVVAELKAALLPRGGGPELRSAAAAPARASGARASAARSAPP